MAYKDKEKKRENDRLHRNTPLGRAKTMVKNFRYNDAKHNRGECTITAEWILENIFPSKCIYCGATGWKNLGCDRIDNSLPHTPENVVCSCWDCNNKRGTTPFDVFVQRLKDGEQLLKKNVPDQSKPVRALDENRKIVMEFPSTKEAGRNGYDRKKVVKCCNGERKTHRGLHWQWA